MVLEKFFFVFVKKKERSYYQPFYSYFVWQFALLPWNCVYMLLIGTVTLCFLHALLSGDAFYSVRPQ